MIDEQEVSGASNSVADAPSLHAARASGRARTATKRLLESQVQGRSTNSTKAPTKRSKRQFSVYAEPDSPPPTQPISFISQNTVEEDNSSISQPKKRPRGSKDRPTATPGNREVWEDDFEAATTKPRKLQVLLEALGHEDFPQRMKIP